jgi:regulator of cell morphogenesis and NO signaling
MRSQLDNRSSLKELVLAEGALAHLFERYGIDYCCHGEETLEAACRKKGLDTNAVLCEIEKLRLARPYSFLHGDLWDEEFLVEYIVENHHRYCRATIPVLLEQLSRLCDAHGDRYSYVKPVMFLFQRACHEIEQHMRKEEMILFPYIKSLASAREFGRRRPLSPFLTIKGPIAKMEEEHLETAQIFTKIRGLLSDFAIPDEASAMQVAVITGMQAFINDLHQHVHLENNLLFPRARALEEEFDKRTGLPLDSRAFVDDRSTAASPSQRVVAYGHAS